MRALLVGGALTIAGCALLTDLRDLDASGDASSPSACAGNHLLCESFDADGGWSSSWVAKSGAATMTVATDDFVSPPASLRVTATDVDAFGILLGTFPSPAPARFTCSVSVRVEGFPNGYYSRLSPVMVYDIADPTLENYEITFMGYDLTAFLDEHVETTGDAGWTDNGHALPYTIVDGAWHRLTYMVQLGSSSSATLGLDGKTGIGATASLTPPSTISGAGFSLGFMSSGGAPAGWVAHFDDAVCDAL